MEEELLRFLSYELRSKEKAREIIDDAFDRFGITSLELTTQDQRKALAVYLKSQLPYHSIAKGNILLSKLLNILGYQADEEKYKFTINKEHKEVLEKQLMIDDFLKEVDRSLIKFELIFNIFWRRAGEAELRGISHDEVIKMTRKALNGVKDELKKAYEELAMKAGFEKEVKSSPPEFLSFGDDLKIPHFAAKEKSQLQKEIEDFWRLLVRNVERFENMFFVLF